MSDTLDSALDNWLTVEAAAVAYRLSERTVRRRLASGEIEGVKVTTPNGQAWRIRPPQERQPTQDGPGAASGEQGGPLIPLNQLEHILAPLAAERERLAAQVETLQSARLDDAQEIGRLKGLLEATRGELDRLRSASESGTPPLAVALDSQSVEEVLTALGEHDRKQRRRRGIRWPWQR